MYQQEKNDKKTPTTTNVKTAKIVKNITPMTPEKSTPAPKK